MTEQETPQFIKDFIEEYKKWAITQHSDNYWREVMKSGWVNNITENVYSKFIKNVSDQIYWLNRCSASFEENFNTTMPDELKYKLLLINLSNK